MMFILKIGLKAPDGEYLSANTVLQENICDLMVASK